MLIIYIKMGYDKATNLSLKLVLVNKRDLKKKADSEGRSVNNLINIALQQYLNDGNKTLLKTTK